MYLPVNTRDEDNPILAILGGMAETFFLSEIGMWASGKSACVAVSCKCLYPRVFCIDDLYHTVSPASSKTTRTSILDGCHKSFDDTPMVLFERDEQIHVS